MKKIVTFLIVTILIISCSQNTVEDIKQLEGYWEIEKVAFPDGNSKKYTISQSIDFFKLEVDSTGYRKKLQPKLDGTFHTSDDAEKFTIVLKDNKTFLFYKNALSEWSETITKLNDDKLVIENENNLKYFYKRFEKLNLTPDGTSQ